MRETETGPLDTPERRAALEARLGEVTTTIGDETVRKYYRQDFGARLRSLLAPAGARPRSAAGRTAMGRRAQLERRPQLERSQAARARRLRAPAAAAGARQRRALCGREPAARGQPGASRPPRRHAAPRGADPAGRAQPSLAAARPPGGHFRASSSATPSREAQARADRHRRAWERPGGDHDGAAMRAELIRRGLRRPDRPGREGDHHRLGLGRAAGGRARRTC